MPFRKAPTYVLAVAIAAAIGAPVTASAGGFSSIFELHETTSENGNPNNADAMDYPPGGPEDWAFVNTEYNKAPGTYNGKAAVRVFVPDFPGLPGVPFTRVQDDPAFGTQCKDVLDLSGCKVITGGIPDKNQITNGYAAFYVYDGPVTDVLDSLNNPVPSNGGNLQHLPGDLIVVMGGDLHAENGSASWGGWFTRNKLQISGNSFVNGRAVGDILVVAEFTNGGADVTFSVARWVGTGGNAGGGTLQELFTGQGLRCSTSTDNFLGCAISNNNGPEKAPWPYIAKNDKTANPYSAYFPATAFAEGILNLSAVLRMNGQSVGCLSDFLFETRTSGQSYTAELKDFLIGSVPLCGISADKSGSTLSKVGDLASYNIQIENTGVVTLYKQSIVDTLLGTLTNANGNCPGGDKSNLTQGQSCVESNTCGTSLAPKATCGITAWRRVAAGDPDPLPNTVTVIYDAQADLQGDEVISSNDHAVNLFQPAVAVTKTGNTLSKIGDEVTYSFTIQNTSSSDSPALKLDSVSDDKLGTLTATASANNCGTLASGASCSFSVKHTIPQGASDPYNNTVTVHYHPDGFPNDIIASDDHSVNLFQPAVTVSKTGNALSKVGDQVTYNFTITNSGSSDSPALKLDSVSDDKLGTLTATASANNCGTLASGASCSFSVKHTIPAGASDPYNNTVTVHYHPDGFPNDISHQAGHSVNLFQPDFSLSKSCAPARVKVGDPLTFTYTLQNTGSSDSPNLNKVSVTDDKAPTAGAAFPATLVTGAAATVVNATYYPMAAGPVTNNVSATYQVAGFPNQITRTASATCEAYSGDQGCTPGFWKNHPEYWDGMGSDDKTATIKYPMAFNVALDGTHMGNPVNVTSAQSGLEDSVTLMDAVNLGGGGLKALNRHTAAALASADSINYPYSVQGVKELYWDAVGLIPGPETVSSALKKLSDANELGCPY
ncbi:hypothetical protein [Thiofaba sp. EF100]|uniref:DUF7507 domain-containing protein n=1 Tax=Thiofaba sp. EF100 TaxID=3121274 RepID=UPI00322162A3